MRFIAFLIFLLVVVNVLAADVISIKEVMRADPSVKYHKIKDRFRLKLKRFPIASSLSSSWDDPVISEAFVATIPNGKVYSGDGVIIIGDKILRELIWPWSKLRKNPESLDVKKLLAPKYISGRVVVLAQEGSSNYYHWMTEVIPKLALIEKSNVKYDWVYLPKQMSGFMKETLVLLGIKPEKIISAEKDTFLRAKELVVPSFVSRSCYTPFWVASYLREKFIPLVRDGVGIDFKNLPKKIFISRSKASYRKIINEDEIRRGLSRKGFVSVNLEELSVKKQIALLNNVEVVIAPHGAGLTNLLFAKPKTVVIEIFQAHEDDTYWYLSQVLKLNHHCIKTSLFLKNGGYLDTKVSWKVLNKEIEAIMLGAGV